MTAEEWIDLIEQRSDGMRRKGILSIGFDGMSAELAPAGPGDDGKTDDNTTTTTEGDDLSNAWENPASYPTGHVPTIEVDKDLPAIPNFGEG